MNSLLKSVAILLFLDPLLSATESGACAAQAGGGATQTMNAWIVNGDQLVQNQTIHLNGTLDIRGGTLTLRNATLEINATQTSSQIQGAVVAINIGPGAGFAVSGSRITAASGAPGSIEGDQVNGIAADSTCFNHVGVSFSAPGPVKFRQNEFVLRGSDSIAVATFFSSTGADLEDNIVRVALDPLVTSSQARANGIYLINAHESAILRNVIIGTVNGISLNSAWNNHIAGNTWKGPIAMSGLNTQAANWWSLTVNGWSGEGGISLDHWSNNNIVEKNTLMAAQSAILFVAQSANNTISQNTIQGAGYGIVLRWASHNLVDGNELADVYDNAIQAHKSHDNTITNNRIYRSGGGVALFASETNTVKSNAVADSDRGIFVHESANNTIDGNTVSGAVQGVFVASHSTGNGVTNNNIVGCDHPGWDDGQANSWKGNFWGAASGSRVAVPPAAAADGAPAQSMLPPTAAPVVPPTLSAFNGALSTVTNIQDHEVWQDARTIPGSISIQSGGSLTLQGATLTYAIPSPTHDVWIYVQPGGSLTIADSKIVGPQWDHPLAIKVSRGAQFSMRRSEMHNAGTWVGTFAAAIANEADNVDIEDSTFENVYCAYSGENDTDSSPILNLRFVNNTITGAVKGLALISVHAGAVVSGNRISRYGEWGIDTASWAGYAVNHLTDNTFSDGWGPAIFETWNPAGSTALETARNTCNSVRGPCRLTRAGGADFRQIHTASTSVSAAQAGDLVEASVLLANINTGLEFNKRDAAGFLVTLTVNGKPVQTRNVALPLGHFERIELSATAGESGAYGVTIDTPNPSSGMTFLGVSKSDLRFVTAPGLVPAPQVLRVVNTGSSSAQQVWTAVSDSAWLHATPSSGVVAGELTVTADSAKLGQGSYTGKIQVAASGAASAFVSVTLSVASGVPIVVAKPSVLSFAPTTGGPLSQSVVLSLTPKSLALPFSVSARTDYGGNWLSATADTSTMPASLTVSVDPSALALGQYVGEVLISTAGSAGSPLSIPVTLAAPGTGTGAAIGSVVNGASFLPGFAASSWFVITGANLSRTTRTWGPADFVQGRLPTSLDGVGVTIDGWSAFVYYVSPTQLNVLAPFGIDTTSDASVTIEVTAPDGKAQAVALKRRFAPGIFVFGGQNVAAVHVDGTLVCAEGSLAGLLCRPAKTGEAIAIYATGLGTNLDPLPSDGAAVHGPSILRDSIEVTLGGKPCPVQYQGLVGPGLYQINVQVPDVQAGDQEVVLSIGGVYSQAGPFMTVTQ